MIMNDKKSWWREVTALIISSVAIASGYQGGYIGAFQPVMMPGVMTRIYLTAPNLGQ